EGEVLVRVHLAGICSTDLEIIRGYGGFEGILGHEFVGTVAAGSTKLAGKRVVGQINCVCGRCDMCSRGLSSHCRRRTVLGISGRPGAFAAFLTLPEENCLEVPDGVSDEEAVFTEPLAAAYQVIRQVQIERRMTVAVVGTGRLGLLVAQVLAQAGCRLIAIGRNPRTLGLLDRRRIRTARVEDLPRKHDQDVVVDCTGEPEGIRLALDLVRPRGTVVMKTTCRADAPLDLSPLVVNEVTLLGSRCGPFGEALSALARKQIDVLSLVTRQMPLADGPAALDLAARPEHIKILLKVTE
ncbi:MAG: alcohol dehydrogenase catalytic domain-containing protein, partial [Phycisphaerae bacterium]